VSCCNPVSSPFSLEMRDGVHPADSQGGLLPLPRLPVPGVLVHVLVLLAVIWVCEVTAVGVDDIALEPRCEGGDGLIWNLNRDAVWSVGVRHKVRGLLSREMGEEAVNIRFLVVQAAADQLVGSLRGRHIPTCANSALAVSQLPAHDSIPHISQSAVFTLARLSWFVPGMLERHNLAVGPHPSHRIHQCRFPGALLQLCLVRAFVHVLEEVLDRRKSGDHLQCQT
jgi:hypothetical protein